MPLFGAHLSVAGGLSRALLQAQAYGCPAVQLFTKNTNQWAARDLTEEDVLSFRKTLRQSGVKVALAHDSYLINLASPKDDLWVKSINGQKDELRRAHAYGIRHVVLHPGAYTESSAEAGIARVSAALNRIHAELPECADTLTLLELTAGQGTSLGYSFGQLAAIIAGVEEKERVGVCVDTCHALGAGYDFRTPAGYAAMMDEIEATIGLSTVKCWHFNDSKFDVGSRKDRHTHIGEGFVGLNGFHHILNDLRWDGIGMLLETPKDEDGDGNDARNLATLVGLVDDPARIPPGLRG